MIYARIFGFAFGTIYLFYVLLCCLELWGFIKFTNEKTTIKFPKVLIPFYYFFK
jgi:hypothetical protein